MRKREYCFMENKEAQLNEKALDILLKKLPGATLRNNLLLMAVAGTSPGVFVPMVNTFFNKDFDLSPKNIIVQKNIPSIRGNKEIRIDVAGETNNNEKIVLEVENGKFNPTRIRYYTSSVNVEAGKNGVDYSDMPYLYMAIIEKGGIYEDVPQCFEQSVYVRELAKDKIVAIDDLKVVDNRQVITHINADFKTESYDTELLKYIHDFNCIYPEDCLIPELGEAISKVKFNSEKRLSNMLHSYQGMTDMVLSEDEYKSALMEGISQGIEEGRIDALQRLIDAGCIKKRDIEKAFKGEKIEGIIFSNGLSR